MVERFLSSGSTTTSLAPQRPAVVNIFLTVPAYDPADPPTLVSVARSVESPASRDRALAALAAGPTDDELRQGFQTAIRYGAPLTVLGVKDGIVTIEVPLDFARSIVTEQIAAFAQIVYTVTALPDVTGVRFNANGAPRAIPLGDGSAAAVPVTRLTYATLARRPT